MSLSHLCFLKKATKNEAKRDLLSDMKRARRWVSASKTLQNFILFLNQTRPLILENGFLHFADVYFYKLLFTFIYYADEKEGEGVYTNFELQFRVTRWDWVLKTTLRRKRLISEKERTTTLNIKKKQRCIAVVFLSPDILVLKKN